MRIPKSGPDQLHVGLLQIKRGRTTMKKPASGRHRTKPCLTEIPLQDLFLVRPHEDIMQETE